MRKRRTREHIIADLSVNHFERFVFRSGHVADRSFFDYGYDLTVRTFDENGEIETELFFVQLKASDSLRYTEDGSYVSFVVSDRDRALWGSERMPVFLIVFDSVRDVAFWTQFQTTVIAPGGTVRIPVTQIVSEEAVEQMRRIKNAAAKR